jgi:hypothetical protein
MEKLNIKQVRIDLAVLMGLFGLGAAATVLLSESAGLKPLLGGIIMLIPSAIYLGVRKPKPWRKVLLATAIFGFLFGFFFEFIQEFNLAYSVTDTILPSIGPMPLDNVVGHACMAFLTFMFYEHFLAAKTNYKISRRYKVALFGAIIAIASALTAYAFLPSLLTINYSYLKFGLLAIIPLLALSWFRPRHLKDLVMIAPVFFVIYFVIEILAVNYDWWIYPNGQYIGYVELADSIRYPIEELLFWMMLYASALLSYYKIFIDKPNK